jgi:hypothetical protein
MINYLFGLTYKFENRVCYGELVGTSVEDVTEYQMRTLDISREDILSVERIPGISFRPDPLVPHVEPLIELGQ